MLLVPFFAEAWGKAKFLHVVRDGRDIAFSGNQTPVAKFYQETFPKGTREGKLEKPPLQAITMWNTWNVGLYQWAASELEKGATGLDYLLLHTEDLIDPDAKVGLSFTARSRRVKRGVCGEGSILQQYLLEQMVERTQPLCGCLLDE